MADLFVILPQPTNNHGVLLLGKFLALLANIRLGWKDLPGANTLAYYEHLPFMAG
jgi:hypothetical protein